MAVTADDKGGVGMEDDEEYSYTGYSEKTAASLRTGGDFVTVTGDEEEYSFGGFSYDAVEETASDDEAMGYGDFIVEEFSAESSAHKISLATHISERKIKFALSFIYLVMGVLCVAFTTAIQSAFPYIVGGMATAFGLVQFIIAVIQKEYVHTHSNKTASSLVMMALGVLIMVEHSAAFTIIAVAWGFLGLMEGAHAFNHAFSRIARSERCVYYLGKGLVEVILAFLLLYEPSDSHHIYLHIIVFGVQMIFDAFTTFPPLKEYLARK